MVNEPIPMKPDDSRFIIVKPTPQKASTKNTSWIFHGSSSMETHSNGNVGILRSRDSSTPTAFKAVKSSSKQLEEIMSCGIQDVEKDFHRNIQIFKNNTKIQNIPEHAKHFQDNVNKYENIQNTIRMGNEKLHELNSDDISQNINGKRDSVEKFSSDKMNTQNMNSGMPVQYKYRLNVLENDNEQYIHPTVLRPQVIKKTCEIKEHMFSDERSDTECLNSRYRLCDKSIQEESVRRYFEDTVYRNENESCTKNNLKCSNEGEILNLRNMTSCGADSVIERKTVQVDFQTNKEIEVTKRNSVISTSESVKAIETTDCECENRSVMDDSTSRDDSVSFNEEYADSEEDIDVGNEADLIYHGTNNYNDYNSDTDTYNEIISDEEKQSFLRHNDDSTSTGSSKNMSPDGQSSFDKSSKLEATYINRKDKSFILFDDEFSGTETDGNIFPSRLFNRLTSISSPTLRRHISEECMQIAIHDEEERSGIFNLEDLMLRNRIIVLLWVLLGEHRLKEVGFPSDPIHKMLWRTVDICCSVAGVKSAAAVPLASDHDCGHDMHCFRDHSHRFLEVCAPTRELWKQFDWAGLTVDAVVRKIYTQEVKPFIRQLHSEDIPLVIQRAMVRIERLEQLQNKGSDAITISKNAVCHVLIPGSTAKKSFQSLEQLPRTNSSLTIKKKRGRPAKVHNKADSGRIERVMLWRFLLNLLEDPRNAPCIHWVQREEGIFRILNTDWLARLWGRRHGNPRMTYEKMARAMRTYYRSKVLQPVPRARNLPRKLVYKFNPAVVRKVAAMRHLPTTFSGRGMNYNTPATTVNQDTPSSD